MRDLGARLDPRGFRRRGNLSSWPWHLAVNVIGASPVVGLWGRVRILRAAGMEIETGGLVAPGCFFFGRDISIAAGAYVNAGCHLDTRGHITIGRNSGLSVEAVVVTSTHDLGPATKRWGAYRTAPVTIDDGAWIGSRAIVLPGVHVAPGSVVATGAVVTRSTEPNGLYAGVPARRVRDLPT